MLLLARTAGEEQYVWVRTWEEDPDAETRQNDPGRRDEQAEAPWALAETTGLHATIDPEDPSGVQPMGEGPAPPRPDARHNHPVTLGPTAGWEPSHEVLEVSRVLAEDDGTQHGDRSRLEELWETARRHHSVNSSRDLAGEQVAQDAGAATVASNIRAAQKEPA